MISEMIILKITQGTIRGGRMEGWTDIRMDTGVFEMMYEGLDGCSFI